MKDETTSFARTQADKAKRYILNPAEYEYNEASLLVETQMRLTKVRTSLTPPSFIELVVIVYKTTSRVL
jgi:hypothetical protein